MFRFRYRVFNEPSGLPPSLLAPPVQAQMGTKDSYYSTTPFSMKPGYTVSIETKRRDGLPPSIVDCRARDILHHGGLL